VEGQYDEGDNDRCEQGNRVTAGLQIILSAKISFKRRH
jgi:hypothetical protein